MVWVVAQTTTIGITMDMDMADMEMAAAETTITAITVMDTATILEMEIILIMEIITESKRQLIHTLETMEEA
jgi:hypothetical protein